MEHHLNLAKAAKLAGISRRQIQQDIKQGRLNVFEGDVSVDSLLRLYPHTRLDNERELERVARIQQDAIHKAYTGYEPTKESLQEQVNRLQIRLQHAEYRIGEYEQLLMESKDRLEEMQKHCDRQQRQTLAAFIGWMMQQYRHCRN